MDEELLELVLAYLPESLETWVGLAIIICAFLPFFWPEPAESAHPFLRGLHALVRTLGRNISHARSRAKSFKKKAQNVKKGKLVFIGRKKE